MLLHPILLSRMVRYGKHVISELRQPFLLMFEVMEITINGEEIILDLPYQQNDLHDMTGKITMTMPGEIRPIPK